MSARSGAYLVFYVTLLKMHHCAAMNTVYDFLCRAWKRRLQESWPTGTEAGRVRDDLALAMVKHAVLARR